MLCLVGFGGFFGFPFAIEPNRALTSSAYILQHSTYSGEFNRAERPEEETASD